MILKDLSIHPPVTADYSGNLVLANFEFADEDLAVNCMIMAGMVFVYRLVAAIWQHFFHTGL
eukprot:CAMPEP_0170283178 /NCGR_PEP_ID=MMETSP0116_2-20130129/41618_1 /TAXON_ID=400756 /ORGANISM="Durinskia baltica, Strain CSIRO CS-38" /LENGTH=61 /DNA_ID=CAMNT_0010534539 /DNA_START=99 /DNA_END=280 /DNA_ORIENTATION=-